mmetsp:Transcript_24993/g.78845  ORF Transcript_24993/g.78845 Transcript_24993/m.78845 type:complete len:212 (-) Transcript_24993:13-648(-)
MVGAVRTVAAGAGRTAEAVHRTPSSLCRWVRAGRPRCASTPSWLIHLRSLWNLWRTLSAEKRTRYASSWSMKQGEPGQSPAPHACLTCTRRPSFGWPTSRPSRPSMAEGAGCCRAWAARAPAEATWRCGGSRTMTSRRPSGHRAAGARRLTRPTHSSPRQPLQARRRGAAGGVHAPLGGRQPACRVRPAWMRSIEGVGRGKCTCGGGGGAR